MYQCASLSLISENTCMQMKLLQLKIISYHNQMDRQTPNNSSFLIFFHILWLLYLQNSIIMFKKYMHDTTICKLLQLVNSIIFFFIKRFQMCNKDDVIEPIVYIYALITCIYIYCIENWNICADLLDDGYHHIQQFLLRIYISFILMYNILYWTTRHLLWWQKYNNKFEKKTQYGILKIIKEELNDLCHN